LAAYTAFFGAAAICAPAFGDPTNKVVSVEEHWELKISEPDFETSAPQATMVISPNGNVDGDFFIVELNHSSAPDYASGGIQVQHWNGEELVESRVAHDGTNLESNNETVTWVQRMTVQDGTLTFQVADGQSESWGTFGGDELSVSLSTSQPWLNHYRPSVSLSESQVGYAENRVVSLTLTKLVWVTEDGQVHEQNAPIPIDTSLDSGE
jgi:hypothetical protein